MAADKKAQPERDELHKGMPHSEPTLLCPCGLPTSEEKWMKMTYRERVRLWYYQCTYLNAQFPVPTVVFVYGVFGTLWWFGFKKFAMDPDQPFFSEKNIKLFIIYNALINLLGFGGTSGMLGFRFKIPFGCGLHFATPGTICSPLIPKLAVMLGQQPAGIRSPQAVASFFFLVASLVMALNTPEPAYLVSVTVAMVINLVFDFSVVQSLRLEHNGYMLVALCFPDWINGVQVVQIGLWFWAGTAKIGPWFKYVIPFITKDNVACPFLPQGLLKKILVNGYPNDLRPSKIAHVAAYLGCAMECTMGLAVMAPHGSFLNLLGVVTTCCYHLFIGANLPFASVQEWNYFCILMSIYLFKENEFKMPTSPLLLAFLFIVSFCVPIWGQLYPTLVPFLTAYRPYMGNWRFSFYILHKSAENKHEKLTTWCSPWVSDDGEWFYGNLGPLGKQGADVMRHFDYFLTVPLLGVPAYRPLVPILEKLLKDNGWNINDIRFSHSEPYQNQVFGWSLGTGWLACRECFREALLAKCGFNEKEMYILNFEPASPIPWGDEPPFGQRVQWRCYDVTKGPRDAQIHGNLPYSECEKSSGPAEMYLREEQMQTGNSIKGTFGIFDVYH